MSVKMRAADFPRVHVGGCLPRRLQLMLGDTVNEPGESQTCDHHFNVPLCLAKVLLSASVFEIGNDAVCEIKYTTLTVTQDKNIPCWVGAVCKLSAVSILQ